MSIAEKIDNLAKVKRNLEKKLRIIADGRQIIEFDYVTPKQWREMRAAAHAQGVQKGNRMAEQVGTSEVQKEAPSAGDGNEDQFEGNFILPTSDIDENEEEKEISQSFDMNQGANNLTGITAEKEGPLNPEESPKCAKKASVAPAVSIKLSSKPIQKPTKRGRKPKQQV